MLNTLLRNGPPPYDGDGMAMKYAVYNNVLFRHMESPTLELILLMVPQFAREYGLLDRVNFARGLIESFPVVYPQLRDLDFITQASTLEVPIYFLVGRQDINAMAPLVERYYNALKAPHKELIWLEGGHGATPEQLADAFVNKVLTQTYPKEMVSPPLNGPSNRREVELFLNNLMQIQLHDNHIAGAAVAVVRDGELLFANGYGYAGLEARKPVVAEQTLLRTDSTGKLFVWTAIMQLVEQGKLDLDADVNTYLDFSIPATFPQPITLEHLMSHSAGFEDRGYLFAHDPAELEPTDVWLTRNIPARVHPPGIVSAYSNYGTALAGYIVERISGLPFEQYVEEMIFEPLAMQNSTFRQPLPEDLATDLTTNYRYANGEFWAVPFTYLRVSAVGEGHATVTDIAKFMAAHLAEGDSPILKASTSAQMHSQLFTHDPRVSGIAYGFVQTTQNGRQILRHEGNNPGVSSSALFLLPEQKVGVYVAFNSNGGFGPGEQFRQAFLNHYYPIEAVPPQSINLNSAQNAELTGNYRSTRMFYTSFAKIVRLLGGNYADITVKASDDGRFTTQGVGSTSLQWVPVEPQVLRLADGAADGQGDLVFDADEQGHLARLYIGNNPYRAYEKVDWYETTDFHLLLLMLCELIFVLALIAFPLIRLANRAKPRTGSANTVVKWLVAMACLLALLFPIGLLLTVEESLLYGVSVALIAVLSMPLVAIVLSLGTLFLLLRGWREAWLLERIHYGTFLVAMIAFVGWLHYWNLLGYRF
jgi:CubicO group peptidase (beta-lactamase class C family)